jgi:hypothetical protein
VGHFVKDLSAKFHDGLGVRAHRVAEEFYFLVMRTFCGATTHQEPCQGSRLQRERGVGNSHAGRKSGTTDPCVTATHPVRSNVFFEISRRTKDRDSPKQRQLIEEIC